MSFLLNRLQDGKLWSELLPFLAPVQASLPDALRLLLQCGSKVCELRVRAAGPMELQVLRQAKPCRSGCGWHKGNEFYLHDAVGVRDPSRDHPVSSSLPMKCDLGSGLLQAL